VQTESERLLRRQFLVALAGFGSLGAAAWVTLPMLPGLVRAAGVSLPAWATTTPASSSAYRVAATQPELLASLPCFCGCVGYQPPHRSLLDCFIRPEGGFEAHAAGCTTCQDEALTARRLATQGLPAAEIHRTIVDTFGQRGPSTDSVVSA
jgi:hypothetical protein